MPAEGQKIERLLESFAAVFHHENPALFDNADAVFILGNAILMLNTSLHNPNMREKDRMSKAGFVCVAAAATD
jgi:guanine nucleotide exchange protein RalF